VTTSLLGYGGTAERRTAHDPGIAHEAAVVESVVRKASGCVHLVGHSFGGVVALAVALRRQVPLASLTVVAAPVAQLLRERAEHRHYQAFRDMTEAYFAAFHDGDADAIATMVDFYGGAGTFASWPAKVRAYAVQTTPVTILDWASFYGLPLSAASLSTIDNPGPRRGRWRESPGGPARQRMAWGMHPRRRACDDRRGDALHDRHTRRSGGRIDCRARARGRGSIGTPRRDAGCGTRAMRHGPHRLPHARDEKRGNSRRSCQADQLTLSKRAVIRAAGSPDPCGPGTAGLGRGRSGACGVNQGRSGFPEAGIRGGCHNH
jgi:pimeloyl-ACP methyl ester carboxylesterase